MINPNLISILLSITFLAASPAQALSVTIGNTVPTVDGADIANLDTTTAFADFNTSVIWGDRPARGQTFTTGTAETVLHSVTVQAQGAQTANGTYTLRIGTVSGTAFTQVVSDASTTVTTDVAANNYVTFTLTTPLPLAANTLYGFDIGRAGSGWQLLNNTSGFAGSRYTTGANGVGGATITTHADDRIFHLDLSIANDTTPPTLVVRSPADDATGVSPNTVIQATFSENVQLGASGSITLDNLSGGSDVVIDVASHGGQLSVAGSVLTINPSSDLDPATNYAVLISAGAVKDNFDPANNFAGISDTTTWNFTTGVPDLTPPTVVSLSPADNATGVGINDNLVITFSENVVKGSGDIVITRTGTGVFETIPVGDARVSVSGAVVTINPTGTFAYSAGYHVELAAGGFKDLANLNFAGISGSGAWNFNTVAAPLVSTVTTASTAPPVVDLNAANIVAPTGGELIWSDRPMQGQTFTSDATGGILKSISLRINDGDGTVSAWKDYIIRVGAITLGNPNVFTAIRTETIRQTASAPSDSWFTFTFGAPITLTPSTLYGFQIGLAGTQASDGIPSIRSTSTNTFSGGQRFTGEVVNQGLGTAANLTTGDLVFHLDIRNPMLPSPNRMLVPVGDVLLTWTNMSPNTGSDVWVDVWFGTEPGSLSLVASKQLNLTSWNVNAPVADTYYWRIDSYLNGAPTGSPVQSYVFEFYVDDTDADGFPDSYELLHTSPPSNVALNRNDDRDTDGINNWDEYQNGSNPSLIDTDGDGLLDGANIILTNSDSRYAAWATAGILFTDSGPQRTFRGEVTIGTSPLKPDTDGDGLPDGSESAIGTNPILADTDADGLKDGVETNTGTYVSAINTGTNPLVADTDGDGAGDWYEVAIIDKKPSLGSPPNSPNSPSLKPNIPYPLPDPDPLDTGVANKPVRVYIMSGQSNMVGFGQVTGSGPGTLQTITGVENKFPNLVAAGGGWTVRNDVKYRGVISDTGSGSLKPDVSGTQYGPELGFGYIMGWHHDEPVLLIKASQGNRGLMWDLLPPGSPRTVYGSITFPAYGESPETFATGSSPTPFAWYAGKQYDDFFLKENNMGPLMTWIDGTTYPDGTQLRHNGVLYVSKDRVLKVNNVDTIVNHVASPSSEPGLGTDWQTYWSVYSVFNTADILDDFASQYPAWAAQGFEIAGFVWWQGYDDTGEPRATRYEPNMVQFIKQVRSYYENRYNNDVSALTKTKPNAPFVLATLATNGGWSNPDPGHAKVAQAQLNVDGAAGIHTEFAGNVKTIEARGFWRPSSESPSDQGYHYNWNAETYLLVGDALGRAMVDLESITPTANTFASWIAGYPSVPPGLAGFDQDADGDGIDNGAENFFGTNPGIGTAGMTAGAGNGNTFIFTHPQNANPATGVTGTYRWSKDLATFRSHGQTDGDGTTVSFNAVTNSGITTVTATVTGTPTARLFVDVKVTQN